MEPSSNQTNLERQTERGLGLPVAMPSPVILAAAPAAEYSGYRSFWLNNPPGANALLPLGRAAQSTRSSWLGVGVIPLAARRPEEIVQDVRSNALPLNRLYLGLGSGAGGGGVERVTEGIRAIRSALACRLVVAALGPRMCRLAGAQADGVLFNWLTPQFARSAIRWVQDGAEGAGRPEPRIMAYVRVALGDEAIVRLQREAASYENIPHYAAHFRRMGARARETAVAAATPADVRRGLAAWDGVVDEVVVRAIPPQDTVEDVLHLLQAARPPA